MREPVVVELPWIPPAELRGNSRAHWRVKAPKIKDFRATGFICARVYLEGWNLVPTVRITFEFFHWRRIDLDNLIIGMKPWVDGLVDGVVVEDDTPDHIVYGQHSFHKCKKGEERTIVTFREVPVC